MTGFRLKTVNYDGHAFSDFYAATDHTGPGWYVFGRNREKYGVNEDGPNKGHGRYVMLCARPDVKARRHPHYNVSVRRGWHTRREAQTVARRLNAALALAGGVAK